MNILNKIYNYPQKTHYIIYNVRMTFTNFEKITDIIILNEFRPS